MIDTVFFLLVFFIIFSLSLSRQSGIGLEPPEGGSPLSESPQVMVLISFEGAVSVNGEPVGDADLAARLAEVLRARPDAVAVVTADRRVPHGRVVQVMEVAHRAGARRFAIGTTSSGQSWVPKEHVQSW